MINKIFERLRRFKWLFFLNLSKLPMSGNIRWHFVKWGGVTPLHPKMLNVRIYDNVLFDTVFPNLIYIGSGVAIASGCKIITHFIDPNIIDNRFHYKVGKVIIEDDVFIGMNVIVCNPVTIGKGAVVGAGSIITKDIPSYQIWAGNPAKFIRNRVKSE